MKISFNRVYEFYYKKYLRYFNVLYQNMAKI